MSIKILTLAEAERTKALCQKYGEVCEVLEGIAPQDYICDNSGKEIHAGDDCAAVLVLPDVKHHNYQHQLSILGNYVIANR